MDLIKYLKERGIINNITDEKKIAEAINSKKGIYIGFDPSFKSLHLGNYIQIHLLNLFAKAGVPAYAIIGGATGRIGDPSGKKSERVLQEIKVIENNILCLKKQICKLAHVTDVLNNFDWYKDMNVLTFLRDIGKLINVNYLLEKDIIKNRLEAGISYAEFSYNLIQGFDFLNLYRTKNIAIQCGGSDQWGNITTGLEMIRKECGDDAKACGLTINLLTKSDGTKFGKSEKGAIYLDAEITSPYEMYQFLLNQADADLPKMYNFFSDLPLNEINKILDEQKTNPSSRIGQKELAKEIVTFIHGTKAYEQCLKISEALFNGKFEQLSLDELNQCAKQANAIELDKETKLFDYLQSNNIVASKRIFRELMQAKTLLVNGKPIEDENYLLTNKDSYFDKYTIIKKGKKNYFIIKWK